MTYIAIRVALTAAIIGGVASMMLKNQDDMDARRFVASVGNLAIWTAVVSGILAIWSFQ